MATAKNTCSEADAQADDGQLCCSGEIHTCCVPSYVKMACGKCSDVVELQMCCHTSRVLCTQCLQTYFKLESSEHLHVTELLPNEEIRNDTIAAKELPGHGHDLPTLCRQTSIVSSQLPMQSSKVWH
jgi:D-hexose-6-phosphate mutarotase